MPNNANIDERVVEMRIDNRQFVDGAEKTMSVLDRLKKALNFKDAGKDFSDLNRAADKVDLSGMARSVDLVNDRFSTLGIAGMRVIQNLTDSVYNFVTRTAKDLTIGQITEGFGKYSDILTSTKTIMAATRDDTSWVGTYGSQMEFVNDQLERLNWFTDETSYNLTEMVNNIGKFTNVGIPLERAVVDMEGIATWAGLSGANANEASRAMYNLAQAMSVGSVKLMDWRSIENANMATKEFKQTVIDIAVEAGTLKQVGEDVYETLNGTAVSANNFNDALSEGWFTGDILEGALDKFGRFTKVLNIAMEDMDMIEQGITTTDVLGWLDKIDAAIEKTGDATEVFAEWQKELAETMDEDLIPDLDALHYAYSLLSDDELALGRRAFVASQEYKTLEDAINATKDAVSSGWMRTFQYIIGDAEQSKKVWTAIGDELYDIFAAGGVRRNQILKLWAKPDEDGISGRDSLLSALTNLYQGIRTYIDPIVEGFQRVFSWGTNTEAAKRLRELTERFREFTERIGLSEEAMEGMANVFEKIFGGIKKFLGVFKPVLNVLGKALRYIHDFVDLFFASFAGEEGFQAQKFMDGLKTIFGDIGEDVGKAWTYISGFVTSLRQIPFVNTALSTVSRWFETIKSTVLGSKDAVGELGEKATGIVKPFVILYESIRNFISGLDIDFSSISKLFNSIGAFISSLLSAITGKDTEGIRESIKSLVIAAFQGFRDALSEVKFSDITDAARVGVLTYIGLQISSFVSSFKKISKEFQTVPEAFTGVLNSLSDTIRSFGKRNKADMILKIAAAVGVLAASIWLLSKVPDDKFLQVTVSLSIMLAVVAKIAKNLEGSKFMSGSGNKYIVNVLPKMAASLIAFAIFLGVAVAAIVKMKDLTTPQLFAGIATIGFLLVMIFVVMKELEAVSSENTNWKSIGKLTVIAVTIRAAGNAIVKIGKLPPDRILAAGAAIVSILSTVALVIYASKDLSKAGPAMAAILSATVLIIAIGLTMRVLAKMDWPGYAIAAVSILTVLGIIAAFMFVAGKIGAGPGLSKFSKAMLLISASLLLLSIALSVSVPAIIALITGFIGILKLLSTVSQDGSWWAAIGMLAVLGIALVAVGVGLTAVSLAAVGFAAAALIIAAAIALVGVGFMGAAAGVAALTVVLIPFGKVLIEFCKMMDENGEVILKILDKVLVGVVTIIMARRLHISLSVLAVIVAIIQVIHDHGPMILDILKTIFIDILTFLADLIPMLVSFLAGGIIIIINGIANTLRENNDLLVDALENLFAVLLETLAKLIARLIGDIAFLVVEGLDEIPGLGPILTKLFGWDEETGENARKSMIDWGNKIATGISNGMVEADAASGQAGRNLMDKFKEGGEEGLGKIDELYGDINNKLQGQFETFGESATTGGENTTTSFVNGILSGASSTSTLTNISKAAEGMGSQLDLSSVAETHGKNFSIGFGNGALSESSWLSGVGASLASQFSNSFAGQLDINSPSKLAMSFGGYWDEGFIRGIQNGSGNVNSAADTLANSMINATQNALATVSALAADDFAISPRITPVIDMSNVNGAAGNINSILSGSQDIALRSAQNTRRSMDDISNLATNMQTLSEARATATQNAYEINIYSQPGMNKEELADEVVYRINSGITRKGVALG